MSDAFSGLGTFFRRLVDSVYEVIAEVVSIDGPNVTRETIDVTHLQSTSYYREFIASLLDGGEVALELNFTRDSYDTFLADIQDTDLQDYEVILPDAENTSFNFQGLVTNLGTSIPLDDKVSLTVTIKISGPVNLNSGSGSS